MEIPFNWFRLKAPPVGAARVLFSDTRLLLSFDALKGREYYHVLFRIPVESARPPRSKKKAATLAGCGSSDLKAWRCPTLTWGDPTLPS
ncbi:MAG: hypothetical protein WEA08_04745, partial [Woeseia sp.]